MLVLQVSGLSSINEQKEDREEREKRSGVYHYNKMHDLKKKDLTTEEKTGAD